MTPGSVDVSAAPATVEVTARWTDSGSGLPCGTEMTIQSRTSPQSASGVLVRSQGASSDATFKGTLTIRRGSANGTWTMDSMSGTDLMGNIARYGTGRGVKAWPPGSNISISVANSSPDTSAPKLESVALSPAAIDVTASPKTINASARVTDAGLGALPNFTIALRSEQSTQSLSLHMQRVSGTGNDGNYSGSISMPRGAAGGRWNIDSIATLDLAGNLGVVQGKEASLWPAGAVTSTGWK